MNFFVFQQIHFLKNYSSFSFRIFQFSNIKFLKAGRSPSRLCKILRCSAPDTLSRLVNQMAVSRILKFSLIKPLTVLAASCAIRCCLFERVASWILKSENVSTEMKIRSITTLKEKKAVANVGHVAVLTLMPGARVIDRDIARARQDCR